MTVSQEETKETLDEEYVHDTGQHIELVQHFLGVVTDELDERAVRHDASKLREPERSIFREGTASRDRAAYGSPEYRKHMNTVNVALRHHYANNRHHPEHHERGIQGMNLMDLTEMICDWMAAAMKRVDGEPLRVREAIQINKCRFGYSDELAEILHNTVTHLLEGAEVDENRMGT